MTKAWAVAVDLDALCNTAALWRDWLRSSGPLLGFDPAELPEDRSEAAAELDSRGAGNWRMLLERWSEERAPVYLHRDSATSAALRSLAATGREVGVFTDAPEPLARIALSHLGADRRVVVLETGATALERLLARLGDDAVVVTTREELLAIARGVRPVGSDPPQTHA